MTNENVVADISTATCAEILDADGVVLARVSFNGTAESSGPVDSLVALRAWGVRLIDANGELVAEVPTRPARELQRFVERLAAGFDSLHGEAQ